MSSDRKGGPRRADDAQAESRAIIERINTETAPGSGQGGIQEDDWIERVGTRIGRTIGAIITVAILAWLLAYILGF